MNALPQPIIEAIDAAVQAAANGVTPADVVRASYTEQAQEMFDAAINTIAARFKNMAGK
jgi:hypothetical protein